MDTTVISTKPGSEEQTTSHKLLVWDLPLRLFHWSLVSVVVIAAITGFLAPEWWLDIHVVAGYAVGILLTFRVVWGIAGSHYSKFATFPLSPLEAFNHLRSILKGSPAQHLGHNPVGAWMIIILLATLAALVVSGLVVTGGLEKTGPLASFIPFKIGEATAEFHEVVAWVLVGCIGIHIAGVLLETVVYRHPVLSAMITGLTEHSNKKTGTSATGFGKRGVYVFATAASVLLALGFTFTKLSPQAVPSVQYPPVYLSECGDCHDAYHPSLASKKTWQAVLSDLTDHYGEDASLDQEIVEEIAIFLTANQADKFDTEVAYRIGRSVPLSTLRMTDTKLWKERHADIPQATFSHKAIGSKINCSACHRDAATGRFDDHEIQIPDGVEE